MNGHLLGPCPGLGKVLGGLAVERGTQAGGHPMVKRVVDEVMRNAIPATDSVKIPALSASSTMSASVLALRPVTVLRSTTE